MSHTPGPWKIKKRSGEDEYWEIVGTTPGIVELYKIADVYEVADVSLIAAAPELLEACKRCLSMLRSSMRTPMSVHSEDLECDCGFCMLRAAIAKVEK